MTRPNPSTLAVPRFGASLVLAPVPWISLRLHRRSLGVVALGTAATIAVALVGLTMGDYPLSLERIVAAVLGVSDQDARAVVVEGRLPRIATGLFAGMALGLSGAIVQAVVRNPLASPDILGITAGASLGAVMVLLVGGGGAGMVAMSTGAVAGAAVVAAATLGAAWRSGLAGFRLLLIGIGISATLASITSFVLIRLNAFDIQRLLAYLSGDLYGRTWEDATIVGMAVLLVAPAVVAMGGAIRTLESGDDVALGLGIRVGRMRAVALVLAVVLAGAAVAAAGPVAFVALVSPHVARLASRTPGAALGPSLAMGALLVLSADLVARRVLAPVEVPVGLVTALLGAPVMLALMVRSARAWRTT